MSHIEKKEFEIYRITPPPPEMDLQEYIRQYVQSGDDKYFYWFLHYYEPTLNEKAKSFRNKYSMEEHFADIKQSLVTGLCKALMKYDITIAPFLPYAQRYMEREVHNYIRTMRTGYSVQSEFEYARLRKVMDIFNHSGGEFTEETISQVATQIGESYLRVVFSPKTIRMFRVMMRMIQEPPTSFCRIHRSIPKISISSRSYMTSCTKPMTAWNIRRR